MGFFEKIEKNKISYVSKSRPICAWCVHILKCLLMTKRHLYWGY